MNNQPFFTTSIIFIIAILASVANMTTANGVLIKQILYDPLKSESGGEAVEIFNENENEINISSWAIKTGKSDADFVFPEGTTLLYNQSFLLADKNWSRNKDNLEWREADAESTITINNKDSGIALLNEKNQLIDAVGWGNVSDKQLYKGTPLKQVKEGNAFIRIRNSGDNQNDFIENQPDFFAKELDIKLEVYPEKNIEDIEIEDEDKTTDGLQITNHVSKNISISIIFTKNYTGDAYINFLNSHFNCKRKLNTCKTEIEIKNSLEAKKYFLEIKANEHIEYREIKITPRKGIQLDKKKIAISGKKGESIIEKLTIKNVGNTAQKIKVIVTDLKNGDNTFESENLFYSEEQKEFIPLKDSVINLTHGENKTIFFKIKINENTKEGNYRGRVRFEVV